MSDRVISLYVTPEIEPVSPSIALMRMPMFPVRLGTLSVSCGKRRRWAGLLTVHGALDYVVVESNSIYHVVIPTTNRADRQAMAARAG